MTATAFDTLKFVRALREKAHLPTEQAEGFAEAIAEAVQADFATKADLKETELRLEAKVEAAKSDIIKWMFGTIGFQTIVIIGAIVTLMKVLK